LKTLLLGWGNPDRQDDGAAWHVLEEVARRSGLPVPEEDGESFGPLGNELDLLFTLQLTPELAEIVAGYERAVFIDAHTGSVDQDLNFRPLSALFQTSPLTHHFTPESCLEMAERLYGAAPDAWLMSVRGYLFGFERHLSQPTALLVHEAVDRLMEWIEPGKLSQLE